MKTKLSILIAVICLASSAIAQDLKLSVVEVTTESITTPVTVTTVMDGSGELIGDPKPTEGEPSDPVITTEKLVAVETSAPTYNLEAETQDWTPIEAELVSIQRDRLIPRRLYRLLGSGKVKVTVETRGPDIENWDSKKLIIDVTPPAPEVEPLDPGNPGLKVLIVYESLNVKKHVGNIIASQVIRNYLRRVCAKDATGNPQFRFIDQHTRFQTCENSLWCQALERARDQVPWIVISNDTTSYEGPLPGDVKQTLDLLKKYGG